MNKKKCIICNKYFVQHSNQKICSNNCRKIKAHLYMAEYYKNNNRVLKIIHNKYYLKNKKKLLAVHKNYYLKNKNYLYKQNLIWREKNKNSYKQWVSNYMKCREKNIGIKITNRIRHRIYLACKAKKAEKNFKFNKYIGCSISYLIKHLELKFSPGMSWNNYGKWHIDHIKPCCKFDLKDPQEQKKCFHYTNLQPLWANDNIKKGGKNYGRSTV